VCYHVERERLVLTGDHVLEGVSPVILAPDGDMTAYLASLAKLGDHDFARIAPGHGGVLEHGKRVLGLLRAHRISRENKVLARLDEAGPCSLDVLTPLVYDDVPAERHSFARFTLEAHLLKLAREGRASLDDGRWRSAA
jgi:glyoxylase-like metal-dependent hydrolase (beta-lactamase superfamily II)